MSYSAGHILIMPKEDWNNATTYKILDAIKTYNGLAELNAASDYVSLGYANSKVYESVITIRDEG